MDFTDSTTSSKDGKKELEELKKNLEFLPEEIKTCPHCGRCLVCGRRYNEWPKPMWEWKPGIYYGNGFVCCVD